VAEKLGQGLKLSQREFRQFELTPQQVAMDEWLAEGLEEAIEEAKLIQRLKVIVKGKKISTGAQELVVP
jgi:hypothetical protein